MAGNSIDIQTALNPQDPHSSSFSHIAYHKVRSSLFQFNAAAGQYCEKVTDPIRDFIRPYQQTGNVHRWYGFVDAINLSISLSSLLYVFRHAARYSSQILAPDEFQLAVNELHEAEKTPEGLTWVVLFSVFLVGFSTLGNFYDEKKDAPWVKYLVFLWPHVRTAGKQIKWWLKGWWALLALLLQYQVAEQNLLIQLFFPLAILGGIFAAINSVWLRWMRDNRKDMVKNNLELIEGIKSSLHQLEKLPKSLLSYEHSLIVVREQKESKETRTLYYINDKAEAELIEMEAQDWDEFCVELNDLQTENIHARMKQFLSYLNRDSIPSRLHFIDEEQKLGGVEQVDQLRVIRDKKYFDSYIYFSQLEGVDDHPRLYYVNHDGELIEQKEHGILFHKKYVEVQQDNNVLNLSAVQLKSISHAKIKTKQYEQNYIKFVNLRQKILATEADPSKDVIKKQSNIEKWIAPVAAGASGIGDGLYFYVFVAKLAIVKMSAFLAMLTLDSALALLATCIITRVSEEFDFQRRLEVTLLRTEVELSKKDCGYLHEELEKLLDFENALKEQKSKDKTSDEMSDSEETIDEKQALHLQSIMATLQHSRGVREKQLIKYQIDSSQLQVPTNLNLRRQVIFSLWNELFDELKLSKVLHEKLRAKLDRSYWAAAIEGLQNGLAIQGALASFSFMIASLCFVTSTACPPAVFLAFLAAGIIAIIICCLQGILSHSAYLHSVEQTEKELSAEFHGEMLTKMTGENKVMVGDSDRDTLKRTMEYINSHSLAARADFLVVELSEMARLLCKGAVKGKNAVLEIFARFLKSIDQTWALFPLILLGIGGAGAALSMRATAKGFAIGRPDKASADPCAGQQARFFYEKPKPRPQFTKNVSGALKEHEKRHAAYNRAEEEWDGNPPSSRSPILMSLPSIF